MIRKKKQLIKIAKYPYPRDVAVEAICSRMGRDKKIIFLNVDQGSPSLDKYLSKYKNQIVHCGISEQNMMTVGAGLALDGKKVFCYGMTPFVSARAFEQVKISLSAMNVPVCVFGVGQGLGYADAGPTHYATEDIGLMYTLPNSFIYTPSDEYSCKYLVAKILREKKFTYFRVDRDPLPPIYKDNGKIFEKNFRYGFNEILKGKRTCIVSNGYTLNKIYQIEKKYKKKIGIIDLYQNSPIDFKRLKNRLNKYKKIYVIDEQIAKFNTGTILKANLEPSLSKKISVYSLPDKFIFENGGRDYLLKDNGLDLKKIYKSI